MIDPGARGAQFDARVTISNTPIGDAPFGGDWCDALELSEDVMALTVGDVSGHGTPVASTMTALHAALMSALRDTCDPAAVLATANDFAGSYGHGVIATAIVAFLNRRLRTLTFANAGHPPPLLISDPGHAYLEHAPADVPLGVVRRYRAANYVVALPLDAMLVFYTDGVTEHERDPIRGEFELAAAARIVYGRPELDDAGAIVRRVFRNGKALDDVAVMAVRTARSPA
jgi:serine phosphatase RsbU (regulator of sigma subunit)